ncbi:hypothetical protein ACFSJY_06865 [Thalassotalea euphylliae]|uniref:hypothetical protein n=1 Tax=Thalassotalea euphylliae TaxID=1655234 RepID=UPI00363C6030
MLKKKCPWCGEKAALSQLGRRPIKQKPNWYQFSRSVQVCPYCAGAVKLSGKAMWFLILLLPSFLSLIGLLITGYDFLEENKADTLGWVMCVFGFTGVYIFGTLEKAENV